MSFKFKTVFGQTQSALASEAARPEAVFQAQSRLGEGLDSTVAVRQFAVRVDEPHTLGGEDTAPNPVEYLLAALGACQEITYRLYADALGIPLDGVSVKVTGAIDLRGFFNVDATVRPGFSAIDAEVTLDSPAPESELARLKEIVDAHCPVLDILRNPTPITLSLQRGAPALAAE